MATKKRTVKHPSAVFEEAVLDLLGEIGFQELGRNVLQKANQHPFEIDGVFKYGINKVIVEVKFYFSKQVTNSALLNAATSLLVKTHQAGFNGIGLLFVSAMVDSNVKLHLLSEYGIILWDRSNLCSILWKLRKDMTPFIDMFLAVQSGEDTSHPFDGAFHDLPTDLESYALPNQLKGDGSVQSTEEAQAADAALRHRAEGLIDRLRSIVPGKSQATEFEDCCTDILKFVFKEQLRSWHRQERSDDELSRYDLVCGIQPKEDFWITLVNSFHTRYVLFEFKNYSEPITAMQIYTTERYLYPAALRRVAIVIAANGADEHAHRAAAGALRENGKLILLLDTNDLIELINLTVDGNSASDYLSSKLEKFLITLSR